MVQFSLTELRVLAGLAEGKTVTEIGEQLAMGHSSVSKALHVTETRAGFPLVEQRGRRIFLTAAGQVLAGRAQSLVREVDELNDLADNIKAGTHGLLRIVASATPADYLLPPVIGEFIRTYPDVRVELRVSALMGMSQDLASGEVDLGIGAPFPPPSGWQSEPLYEDAMTFVVAPRSRLAPARDIFWAELRTQLLIGQFRQPFWGQVWGALTRKPFDAQHTVELRTAEAIKRLVAESDGVGVLPRSAVEEELGDGRLVALHLADVTMPVAYVLFTRSGRTPTQPERAFCALVRERLAPKPAAG
ncbi:MAG: LysR family transcriptional regulator [Chloroflexi bacterium]|nr:LysR family transcriptional regulator [Chloroflexota bacterium]